MANYTDLTLVKADLGITDSSKDTVLTNAIRGISAFINSVVSYDLENKLRTELYDVHGYPYPYIVYTKHRPITAITHIKLKSKTGEQTLTTDDYYLYDRKVVLNAYLEGYQALEIRYTAGYLIDWNNTGNIALHNLPWDIEQVARMMVIEYFNQKDSLGLKSETVGSWSRSFLDKGLSNENNFIKKVLNHYAKPSI